MIIDDAAEESLRLLYDIFTAIQAFWGPGGPIERDIEPPRIAKKDMDTFQLNQNHIYSHKTEIINYLKPVADDVETACS